jgi:hypothetical protein
MTAVTAAPRAAARPPVTPQVSVLVPAKDEAENLPLFLELCEAAFRGQRPATR